jgi:ribosomal protein L29
MDNRELERKLYEIKDKLDLLAEKFDEIDNRLRKASSEIDIVSKDIARVKELSE